MCGIAGVIDNALNEAELRSLTTFVTDALYHRGPDDAGVWIDEETHVALGHRRLSIHDLSPLGAQPMCSASGNLVIAFNGEIYNFKSIGQKLSEAGCRFRGSSDTEILVNAIEYWGLEATLGQCVGMFAFAVYDKVKKTLTLARDRIGEKPLYYGFIEKKFIFASELKGILSAIGSERPGIDVGALSSYFRYGYISAPHTIYENIKKLEPGAYFTINVTEIENGPIDIDSQRYWTIDSLLPESSQSLLRDEELAVSKLDTLLNYVVGEQALADVPLGAFLSGGIDSSVVASILQSQNETPIDTFTIGFDDPSFNEAEHAKAIASHIGSRHNELYISARDALNVVPSLSRIYDEPFSDSSQIPMLIVSRLARKKVTVCLSGDGGDELFCGYNRYTHAKNVVQKMQKAPDILKKLGRYGLKSISPGAWDYLYLNTNKVLGKKGGANFGSKMYKLADLAAAKDAQSAYDFLCSYWSNPEQLFVATAKEPLLTAKQSFETNFLGAAMEWDQKWYLPGDNLVKTDRASMDASLELRVPLLDLRVIEFSWSIENELKLKQGLSKWILRQVLYKYVPSKLIDRPKMGFSIPIGHWLRNDLRDWAESFVSTEFLSSQGIFRSEIIQKIWRQHLVGSHDHSNKLWTFFMFQDWYATQYLSK
ncbi:MAG: asparagine synthase (glutamine-hydrolyzing) [Cellvibrio sp.]|uniref:asparagine synthase (glutamine-hydrolyzing) n=1 Tax=Cellvibrio sp. TaxID=1965322 RepID=UPI00319FA2E8